MCLMAEVLFADFPIECASLNSATLAAEAGWTVDCVDKVFWCGAQILTFPMLLVNVGLQHS